MQDEALNQKRQEAAEELYQDFDFGPEYQVLDSQGWESDLDREDASFSFSRIIYFDDGSEADSIKGHLKVDFDEGSAEPKSATAYIKNQAIEWYPATAPAP